MRNLYWKTQGEVRNLASKPFATESELEQYVFKNQDILGGDIYIMWRQISTGSKQGIPDMLGVDRDSRICVIEIKNEEAQESILPQSLGYTIWAETNPDSVKALWLESKSKPEGVNLDWDNLDIRIILIAPSFSPSVIRMVRKIGYPVDLVQIERYSSCEDEFLIVDFIEPPAQPGPTTTKAKSEYDWDYYEKEHGKKPTAQLRTVVELLAAFVKEQGWNLPYNLNKWYVGFKLSNKVVFTVQWMSSYVWRVLIRIPENLAKEFKGQHWEYRNYDDTFRLAAFQPLNPDSPDIAELKPLLIEAYRYVSA